MLYFWKATSEWNVKFKNISEKKVKNLKLKILNFLSEIDASSKIWLHMLQSFHENNTLCGTFSLKILNIKKTLFSFNIRLCVMNSRKSFGGTGIYFFIKSVGE